MTTTDITDDNLTKPMRAVVMVAYVHADAGNDRIKELQEAVIDAVVQGPDWVDDYVQLVAATILPLGPHEGVEWYVDDLDDLDEWDLDEIDDLRDTNKHGSTPR